MTLFTIHINLASERREFNQPLSTLMLDIPTDINTKKGAHLILRLDGCLGLSLAEVIQQSPLVVKVAEEGEGSRIEEDGIEKILGGFTEMFQRSRRDAESLLLTLTREDDWPTSALASLGLSKSTSVCSIDGIKYPEPQPF